MGGDEQWTEGARRARELFDASVEGLDAATRSQLNRARQAAIAEAERSRHGPWRTWLPAAAAASVALLAVVLWRLPGHQPGGSPVVERAPTAEVVELLAIGDEIASEDPEFLTWLADRGLPTGDGSG